MSVCVRERAVSDLTLKCPSNAELQRVKAVRVCSGARLGLTGMALMQLQALQWDSTDTELRSTSSLVRSWVFTT